MSTQDRNRCEILATSLDDNGYGIGTHDGTTVFVRDLLPGERGIVQISHRSQHKAHAWADLLRLVGSPSRHRQNAQCPAFSQCGGCAWQHVAYSEQLRLKRQRIVDEFAQFPTLAHVQIADAIASPRSMGYRNKGKYVVAKVGSSLELGAFRPRTHSVVATTGCKVVAEVVDEVAVWTRGAAIASNLIPYDEASRSGELRYVVVRQNASNDVLVGLVVTASADPNKLAAVARTLSKHPAVRGVVAVVNERSDGAILPAESTSTLLFGAATLPEQLAGATVWLGIHEFFQVNLAQALAMYSFMSKWMIERSKTVIDVYAGVGGISLHLAARGATVTAIEIESHAVIALNRAAAESALPITAICGHAALLANYAADGVVVNPPRKGLDPATLAALVAMRPRAIGYVSCGPQSLARDLNSLVASGYRIAVVQPFDLMPHTAQIETVVGLVRA